MIWKIISDNCKSARGLRFMNAMLNQDRSVVNSLSTSNSNIPENGKVHIEKGHTKRTRLSPMSRVSEMLSNSKNLESDSKDINVLKNKLLNSDQISHENNDYPTNPINYNPSNPRSVKNMSYLDTDSEKVDSTRFAKRIARGKLKSLSVEDRIQSLKNDKEDK